VPCGCCLLAAVGSAIPRLVLIFVWIFTDMVTTAFSSWIAPLVGLILLPYTTLIYVLLYAPGEGVTGFGWLFVAIAFLIDISHYTGGTKYRGRNVNEMWS
jgi:hypothetical protein